MRKLLTSLIVWKSLLLYVVITSAITEEVDGVDRNTLNLPLKRSKRWEHSTFQVQENQRGTQKITGILSSFDKRDGTTFYSIEGEGAGSLFRINRKTGELFAEVPLDRESKSEYSLSVFARDFQGNEIEPPNHITIAVTDKNDNDPHFSSPHYFATVEEKSAPGTLVKTITATDADDPKSSYGQLEYSLLPSNGRDNFVIVPRTGEIKTATMLDREKEDTFKLIIQAKDDPGADMRVSRVTNTTLTVTVGDVNDNPPVFKRRPYTALVPEVAPIGHGILHVGVTDADLGQNTNTVFEILPGGDAEMFEIESVNNVGEIKIKKKLDYETAENHEYRFKVKAVNVAPPKPAYFHRTMEDETDVIVTVGNINEPPEFTKTDYSFAVVENESINTPLYSVSAKDPEGDRFIYWIEDDDLDHIFFVDSRSGMISLKRKLDREKTAQYQFKVAAGIAELYSTALVKVSVLDVNDNPPTPVHDRGLELFVCEGSDTETQVLIPNIVMKDADTGSNGAPFHYFPMKNANYRHFKLVDNNDSTASLHSLHNDFYVTDNREYRIPILVEDSGKPNMNATYQVTVQVCYCDYTQPPICDAVSRAGGFHPVILVAITVFFLLLLVVVIMIIVVRHRRRRKTDSAMLIKGSLSSCDTEVQNFISYTEEGGGEEDTAAFDLSALQRDCPSSISGSGSGLANPPSATISYVSNPRRRPFIPSQDVREFIAERKAIEDENDRKLAYDSLQVYGYEGEGSAAGSLSSICSSATDSDQNYDYLNSWGPRFQRLADMYGGKHTMYPHASAV